MCGFVGEFAQPPFRADVGTIEALSQRLIHRGPDEQGAFVSGDGRCAMAFRRLAVIDLAGSHQPMTSTDGRVTLAINGEIYNFQKLRNALIKQGFQFQTQGDAEVVLHLYRRDGLAMLDSLEGMFALAIYDAAQGTCLLARDRMGEKPLFYAQLPGRVVFASEPKALLGYPGVDTGLDMLSIQHFLTLGYVPAPGSVWRSVRKLLPGQYAEISTNSFNKKTYWSIPPAEFSEASRAEVLEKTRGAVRGAVESMLTSDVPLGALLSGGVDSSIVVGLMSQAAGKAGGVRTFTAGFDDGRYDERPLARQVAQQHRTDHTELLIHPAPAGAVDALVDMYDEPFGDSSALPTWLICQAARAHVTVALVGDGGDEVFAGYDRYRAMQMGESLGGLRYLGLRTVGAVARLIAPQNERSRLSRLVRLCEGLDHPPAVQYFAYRRLFGPEDLERLMHPAALAGQDAQASARWFCELYEQGDSASELDRAQRHDLATYLPDDLLVKADRASMACSLELRAPLLDRRVVEVGLSIPPAMRRVGGRGKAILREAFADLMPAAVLAGRKRGFGVPLARWLREDLRPMLYETLLDPRITGANLLQTESVVGLINDHIRGKGDHSHRLWALLMLGRWLLKRS